MIMLGGGSDRGEMPRPGPCGSATADVVDQARLASVSNGTRWLVLACTRRNRCPARRRRRVPAVWRRRHAVRAWRPAPAAGCPVSTGVLDALVATLRW